MKKSNYYIKRQVTKVQVRDLEIEFNEKIAIDPDTEEEIYIRELEIENDIKLYDLYKEKKGLLQSFEIKKIREKYNLNQRDYSILLGMGEITIHRYENGTIQNDTNDSIIRFSANPENMESLAIKNKDKVNREVFIDLITRIKKLKQYFQHKIANINIEELNKLNFHTEHVEKVAEKVIEIYNKKVDQQIEEFQIQIPKITNLELQKLMYYVQGISLYVFNKVAFEEDILAWDYGPIIYELYCKYKNFKNNEIDIIPNQHLSDGLEQIINIVVDSYGKFTGRQLINLTHEEDPWKTTQKNNIIESEVIYDYFNKIYNS